MNHFKRFYGEKKLNEITPEDVDIYKQRRLEEGVVLGTIRRVEVSRLETHSGDPDGRERGKHRSGKQDTGPC